MSTNIHSATGVGWVRSAWLIFKTFPLGVIGLVAFYMLLLFVANLIGTIVHLDFLGVILGSLVMPFGTLAFAVMGREVAAGSRPQLITCFEEGLRNGIIRNKLLLLGLIYGVCVIANGWLAGLLSRSAAEHWIVKDGAIELQSLMNNLPWTAIIICGIIYALILCVTCFSPLLVAWKGQSIGKAFFFSLLLCMRNIIPLLAYGLAIVMIGLSGTFVTVLLGSMLGGFSIFSGLWALLVTSLFYSGLWPMWVTFFGSNPSKP